MSFSNPKLQNPCSKFIEFKGDSGTFQFYDKEQEKNIQLSTPCFIIVLDQLSTIRGFSDDYQTGIYSNEVHSLLNEILKVKSFKGGISIIGLYNEVKHEIKAAGGKFAKSVYCMMFDPEGNRELVNFQLSGAAFSAWLDFKFDAQQHVVEITADTIREKKGSINYYKPIFKRWSIKKDLIPYAVELDKKLQAYLKQRKEEIQEQQTVQQEKSDQDYHQESPVYYPDKTPSEVLHEINYEQDKHAVLEESKNEEADFCNDLPF